MERNVMLAFPHNGTVRTDFLLSVLSAAADNNSPINGVVDERTGPFMAQARGRIATAFLASGLEWLFMVDSDMTFNERTLPALLAWADPDERPLIGAVCQTVAGSGGLILTAYEATTHDGKFSLDTLTDLPPDQLVPVAATGCACLLAHRSVFTRITDKFGDQVPWFAEQVIEGHSYGEDLSFCLRAADAGIQLYIHSRGTGRARERLPARGSHPLVGALSR